MLLFECSQLNQNKLETELAFLRKTANEIKSLNVLNLNKESTNDNQIADTLRDVIDLVKNSCSLNEL